MDMEYDRKFEEMKKYIPFLESMIKRLESTNNGVKNPRKAQLDKIRSLRDLLMDKKKRMKMENLLKCEQVLVNLYAKVEQRDSMADSKEDGPEQIQKDTSDLDVARNKLNSIVSKLQEEDPETLPEIARASNTEVVCTPGSKEPALFQRRPNKASPQRLSPSSRKVVNTCSTSKRHYTRVLLSPDRKKKEWPTNSDINADKPLFSRRSPRRSPRRCSPSYKKERKKFSRQRSKSNQHSKDLNITLKVPEERLRSLNTKDILSRIIHCNDNDVDIDTLRGLRSQILGELKQTGSKDDISDLILKSYKKNDKQSEKKDEVEEGELSDSESEAIENIYGSLVVVNEDGSNSNSNKTSSDNKQPKKIQICLVINSDKEKDNKIDNQKLSTTIDVTDFEDYTEKKTSNNTISQKTYDNMIGEISTKEVNEKENNPVEELKIKSPRKVVEEEHTSPQNSPKTEIVNSPEEKMQNEKPIISSNEIFQPNFYQPIIEEKSYQLVENQNSCKVKHKEIDCEKAETTSRLKEKEKNSRTSDSSANVDIKKEAVSEIDILQALKNEILGQTPMEPVSETITPPLHQPKITKVVSALEIAPKKRISIEKYKQKSVPTIKEPLFNPSKHHSSSKDENLKKQSLKLTEKECERFNFPVDVSPVDSSDDEENSSIDVDFPLSDSARKSIIEMRKQSIDLAPKSPDHEDFADTGIKPPVIIPSDPVKNVVVTPKVDIDMRTLIPSASPVDEKKTMVTPSITGFEKVIEATWKDINNKAVTESRTRMESNQPMPGDCSDTYVVDSDNVSRSSVSYQNVTSSISSNITSNIPSLMSLTVPQMTPTLSHNIVSSVNQILSPLLNTNIPLLMTPNIPPNILPNLNTGMAPNIMNVNPGMTPSRMVTSMNPLMTPILTPNARSYEMTPRPNFDEEYPNQKHVYAPIFPALEPHDFTENDNINTQRSIHIKRNDRYKDTRLDSPHTLMECPPTPNPSFGRLECPSTPNPSFGRLECPPTPNPSFGRMDCPHTPIPSFGRMECPATPNPSFGRMETSMTSVLAFGRSDCSMIPSHSFGRSDSSRTPTTAFGRNDYHHNVSGLNHKYIKSQDPRFKRSSDFDKYQSRNDDRHRPYIDDDRNTADNSNKYRRNHAKSYEQRCTKSRDSMTSRRESSDESYSKDHYGNDSYYVRERYRTNDDLYRRRDYSDKGIGRRNRPEDTFSTQTERGRSYAREDSLEKPISVQSHTGRSFNIDTSFNRTFQDTNSMSFQTTFEDRRRRASSVGRSLRDSNGEDLKRTSTNHTKPELLESPDLKTLRFRRASSVGRDLRDYNTKKNFNDIKEDLRSCKFNNYNFQLRDQDNKSKEKSSYERERLNERLSHTDVSIASTKYTVHPTHRNTRGQMGMNDQVCNKFHNNSKYSPRKNIRDPRMRREVDDTTISKDKYEKKNRYFSSSYKKTYGIVYSNDNIAKGTILASTTGVKNFKIPKIKRPVEDKDVGGKSEPTKNYTKENVSLTNAKKEDSAIDTTKKRECKIKSGSVFDENQRTLENSKENVTISINKSKSKEILPPSKKVSDKANQLDNNLSYSISDGCDRYITRSMSNSIKSGTTSKQISKVSPIRKSRRFKKPVIYDSDSDCQENEINNANINKTDEDSKNIETADDTIEIKQKFVDIEDDENIEKSDNFKHTDIENFVNRYDLTNEQNALDKNENTAPSLRNELCDEQNDLDMSFGVDDELFSDNVASESVLDNINALIAGLDHDIEAPKINDFNENFIDNIVGSISSIDSDSAIGNKSDMAADMLSDTSENFIAKGSSMQLLPQKNNTDVIEVAKVKNNSESKNVLTPSENAENIQNESNDLNDNKEILYVTPVRKNIDDTVIQENTSKSFNADTIDSTTADEQKNDVIFSPSSLINNDVSNHSFVPDSTINSEENDLNTTIKKFVQAETSLDSTNKLISDMNTNVTSSTNNSVEMTFKEQSSASSTVTDDMPRIDSIGKLLSILEDKNKIKELLTMLGKDSRDNEKIKKKLEKLSEIVSDDDEISEENKKYENRNEEILLKETNEKEIDSAANKIQSSDKNKKIFDANKLDKALKEGKLTTNLPLLQEGMAINKEDKDLCKNVTEQGNLLSLPSEKLEEKETIENINKDELINETGEVNTGKEGKEKKEVFFFNDAEENTEKDFTEQAIEVNEKGNQTADSMSGNLKTGKKNVKKSKITKRGRSRLAKKLLLNKEKRVTRSGAENSQPRIPPVAKKTSRELLKLQEDIRDMFISQDILNATGIRMCRLAKLGIDKHPKSETQTSEVEPAEPIVVLENIHSKMSSDESLNSLKKRGCKNKPHTNNEASVESGSKGKPKYKPGPKSKTKRQEEDPYSFEIDSIGESNNTVDSKDQTLDSDSDSASTKSFGSSELLVELKKTSVKKRKRRSWQLGVIRKKGGKNKSAMKHTESCIPTSEEVGAHELERSNINCFTDKSYCFDKNIKNYLCRLCGYRGNDIVPHYKKHHPHSEIPLSRLNPETAKEAIEQCENMNLQAVSKIHTIKYVCRFCFHEFRKPNTALETFFWHVVSVHTGEYKQLCSECINVTRCPFHLDIPPPPKNLKGQLIGYICGRCNFTQVSLENLKTHVIVRHDDEQTEVYSINLGEIPSNVLQSLLTKVNETPIEAPRVLRSTRSNQSATEEPSDDCSDITDGTDHNAKMGTSRDQLIQEINKSASPKISALHKIQSKLIFENDYLSDTSSYSKNDEAIRAAIKLEQDDDTQDSVINDAVENTVDPETESAQKPEVEPEPAPEPKPNPAAEPKQSHIDKIENAVTEIDSRPTDVFNYPHFKIKLSKTGTKEYVCCVNGIDNHYKTTLLISFKKHVQLKHSENWDGYCFVCKVIVIAQGKHQFKDCLQHFLDKHIDNFPILEETPQLTAKDVPEAPTTTPMKELTAPKQYVSVRPLTDLISSEQSETDVENLSMPKIHSIMSLGISTDSPNREPQEVVKMCNYEETQAEVMKNKHRIVLEAMSTPEKLIQIFKCAGRFCSYTTNNTEEALLHASTHQKIGGDDSLRCAYCNFDSCGNAIDLVMHVFKNYSNCPFACSQCFYRAAGSQLVYAHIKRVHTGMEPDNVPILSSGASVDEDAQDDLLSRDVAVLFYTCNNRDPEEDDTCQYKTFVLTKFHEHLQTKHANDKKYSCFMCGLTSASSKFLSEHLKSHGLRIYQCCRCLFGANNELDLLEHASEKHPFKLPKAYLRVITSKVGSSEARVLPLVVLSKIIVSTTVVTPSINEESPVKQAERSIDLEKFIGQTNLMINTMSTITNAATIEPVDNLAHEFDELVQREQASCSNALSESRNTSPATLTLLEDPAVENNEASSNVKSVSIKSPNPEADKETQPPPLLVIDPVAPATIPPDNDVVCLDSDEESSNQIIDLSVEDTPKDINSTSQQEDGSCIRLSRSHLYKCFKCSVLCKSEGMFKRHIISCFPNCKEVMKCAYCSYVTNANKMVDHYNDVHLESTVRYNCAICDGKFVSMAIGKKHMKVVHDVLSTTVTSRKSTGGLLQYVIGRDDKEQQPPKRKMSGDNSNKALEPAHKLKKFGPNDIDKLPINPILDSFVFCTLCEFSTKVRINMVRHLQMHAEQQPVPRTAPINPVPHLESNEKHFDKMVNLASSSIVTLNKTKDGNVITTEHLSAEAAAIYPKYVSDKLRYTCGAKDCAYISVNEGIFKIHWETLHSGTTDYHCVHCPPHQFLDTSKPLTAVRIISHLKMHDSKLYACSLCTFYHFTRKLVEKHLKEVHSGKLIIVREQGTSVQPTPPPPATQSAAAPTMDLKLWQCGLCKFKSMLRPEVIEHCSKFHQSKMQFKCMYCGFRASNIANISKHQSKQHSGKKEEVFYFYYREGSIPDDPDGTALWQRQSQKNEPEIKTEIDISPTGVASPVATPLPPMPTSPVNLDIVKKEPEAHLQNQESIEELCKEFGQFGEPNGLNYKCSLCKVVVEDTKEAMQSHLYEELQYRKWGCGVCTYKAFHKPGLQMHVRTEHGHSREAREPIELQIDPRIETWVARLLEHQTTVIERNKENLAKQKAEILRANPGPSAKVAEKSAEPSPSKSTGEASSTTMVSLEKLFGPFGVPNNMNYTCPKCNISARSEAVMQEHLEAELNKIRWYCNNCGDSFQTYHEAQFHCRSVHQGLSSRPMEVTRNVSLRNSWVAAALRVQKLSMNYLPVTETPHVETLAQQSDSAPENSLLVVRYEENVPTPEEQMKLNNKSASGDNKANQSQPSAEEADKKSVPGPFKCQYCTATYKYENFYQTHVLKHYGLKPYSCPYCPHTDYRKSLETHIIVEHPNKPILLVNTRLPNSSPASALNNVAQTADPEPKIVCLVCEDEMITLKSQSHYHDGVRPQFGIKGSVVYRCWTCLTLYKTSNDFNQHCKQYHSREKKTASFYKLVDNSRALYCNPCKIYFPKLAEYRAHHQLVHNLKTPAQPGASDVIEIDDDMDTGQKRKAEDSTILPVAKRVAKKSTTKLPHVMAVARKSTTKLPYNAPSDEEEYSYYGTKPSTDNLENVTTLMPFCNTLVPFTLNKLNDIIKIYPIVAVKDISIKK